MLSAAKVLERLRELVERASKKGQEDESKGQRYLHASMLGTFEGGIKGMIFELELSPYCDCMDPQSMVAA